MVIRLAEGSQIGWCLQIFGPKCYNVWNMYILHLQQPHQQPHHTTNHTTSLPALQIPHCFCCFFMLLWKFYSFSISGVGTLFHTWLDHARQIEVLAGHAVSVSDSCYQSCRTIAEHTHLLLPLLGQVDLVVPTKHAVGILPSLALVTMEKACNVQDTSSWWMHSTLLPPCHLQSPPWLPGPRQHINIWDAILVVLLAKTRRIRRRRGQFRDQDIKHVSKYPLASAPWPRFPRALKHFRSERRGISSPFKTRITVQWVKLPVDENQSNQGLGGVAEKEEEEEDEKRWFCHALQAMAWDESGGKLHDNCRKWCLCKLNCSSIDLGTLTIPIPGPSFVPQISVHWRFVAFVGPETIWFWSLAKNLKPMGKSRYIFQSHGAKKEGLT